MKPRPPQLSALPLEILVRHPDVMLAGGVAAIIAMLILPLPALALDGLLAANLALAAVILVAVLLSKRPLALSTFPTLLLITTLFRLALNVSTTRMILGQGTAGDVVEAFGRFVIRGDVVVGLVVFLIITLVQFLVIGKGAERVAEVGARFTLDAMPGKQMSIDAAVRSGSIDEAEAQDKREDLARESQFYGAMDGAMKFVKGDAIAGLVITALNLVAGLVIGVARHDLALADAAETYCILTVGDGLVSQIPALLITLSAGVLTTRVASKDASSGLGRNLRDELLSSPKVLAIGAAFALALGLVPGLPLLPFAVIAAGLGAAAALRRRFDHAEAGLSEDPAARARAQKDALDKRAEEAEQQRGLADQMAPAVTPLGLDIEASAAEALGLRVGQPVPAALASAFEELRNGLYLRTGIRFPAVNIRPAGHFRRRGAFQVLVKDVPVLEGIFDPDQIMVVERPERVAKLGLRATPVRHPISGHPISLVPSEHEAALTAAGLRVWAPPLQLALHLHGVLTKHATQFVGLQEVSEQLLRLEQAYPALVRETVPKVISLAGLADVLRRLVEEGVSVRDLKSILECVAACASHEPGAPSLTERVRAALSLQIAYAHAGLSKTLSAVMLDPVIEDTVQDSIEHCADGTFVQLDPEIQRAIVDAVARTLQPVHGLASRPVILTQAGIRRYVRALLGDELGEISVLSYEELPADLTIQPLGRVVLADELAAA